MRRLIKVVWSPAGTLLLLSATTSLTCNRNASYAAWNGMCSLFQLVEVSLQWQLLTYYEIIRNPYFRLFRLSKPTVFNLFYEMFFLNLLFLLFFTDPLWYACPCLCLMSQPGLHCKVKPHQDREDGRKSAGSVNKFQSELLFCNRYVIWFVVHPTEKLNKARLRSFPPLSSFYGRGKESDLANATQQILRRMRKWILVSWWKYRE